MTDPYHAQQYDLGDAVQLDNAETLAGPLDDDPLDSGWAPPDRPLSVDRPGVSPEDGSSLDARLAEEESESEETSLEPADPRAGRLVGPDEGVGPDEEADLVARDVGIDGGAATAEEAAVHIWDLEEL